MMGIEAVFGAAWAFFQPAYSGLLPQTAPEPEIQDARALSQSTANLAIAIGPALGTLLSLGFGAGEAFAFDAATFVLSALLLRQVHYPRERGVPSVSHSSAPAAGAARRLPRRSEMAAISTMASKSR
jgi:predicted MFS family arabinose efflux permease